MNNKQTKLIMIISGILAVISLVCILSFFRYPAVRFISFIVGIITIDVFFNNKRKLNYKKMLEERERKNQLNGVNVSETDENANVTLINVGDVIVPVIDYEASDEAKSVENDSNLDDKR